MKFQDYSNHHALCRILILGVCLLEDLLGRWERTENHCWFFSMIRRASEQQLTLKMYYCSLLLNHRHVLNFFYWFLDREEKSWCVWDHVCKKLSWSSHSLQSNWDFTFLQRKNQVQAQACLQDDSLRESFLLQSCELLLQRHYQETGTLRGTAWKMQLCQVATMRSCLLLDLVCTHMLSFHVF